MLMNNFKEYSNEYEEARARLEREIEKKKKRGEIDSLSMNEIEMIKTIIVVSMLSNR